MVKKEKEVDCVRMKNEIQQKLLEEMKGLSPEEWRRRADERVLANPILGPFWRRVRKVRTSGLRPKT